MDRSQELNSSELSPVHVLDQSYIYLCSFVVELSASVGHFVLDSY